VTNRSAVRALPTRSRLLIAEGAIVHSEVAAGAQVCMLGHKTADDLFLGDEPVGQTAWINRKPCEVIGVIAELETVDKQERTRSKPNEAFYLPVSTAVQNLFENEP
jgi:hypothetical protein